MKLPIVAALLLTSTLLAQAENKATQSPITMERLMGMLGIQGGNFSFEFDEPVFARVTILTTDYPDGKKQQIVYFDTDSAKKRVDLEFVSSPSVVGEPVRGDQRNDRKLYVNLANRNKGGQNVFHYFEKFAENRYSDKGGPVCEYKADIPAVPELDKDYILYWYFREGDPYQAKVTIRFSATSFKK